ncbi:hypothetical protein JCM10450v2_007742 [Rhodotorula kratochvilovae]
MSALTHQRPWARLLSDRRALVALGALALLLVFASSSSHHPTSFRLSSASRSPPVWASTQHGLTQRFFASPYADHRATFVHAVVRREDETQRREDVDWDNYVSIPVHVEKLPYKDEGHQVKSTWTAFVQEIVCTHTFAGQTYETKAFQSFVVWVQFVGCPLPRELDAAMEANPGKTLETTMEWKYKEGKGSFVKTITLKAHYPEPESEFGICLSPVWGHLDARATLEWRENMRSLGVATVHWHARDASVGDFVERYNRATGAKDTFMYAPPMSLETYGHRKNMADAGLYGDQILYYVSCKFRSHQLHPTRWLAHLDRDEDFIPKKLPSASLSARDAAAEIATLIPDHFASLPADLGSACFGKGYHSNLLDVSPLVPEKVARTPPLELAYIEKVGDPGASVNYGERWFPGFHAAIFENGTQWMSPSVPFRFLHQVPHGGSLNLPASYTPPYPKVDLEAYLARLWELRERTWDKIGWGCSEIPCRFEDD